MREYLSSLSQRKAKNNRSIILVNCINFQNFSKFMQIVLFCINNQCEQYEGVVKSSQPDSLCQISISMNRHKNTDLRKGVVSIISASPFVCVYFSLI